MNYDNYIIAKPYLEEDLITLNLWLPGEPISKQSVRYGTTTFRTPGEHRCPWTNNIIKHKKGDVVCTKTASGIVRAITFTYQEDARYKKRKTDLSFLIKSQMNEQKVKMFQEIVIIEKYYVIFTPIKSLKKTELTAINNGYFIFKKTKPDLPDNLKKFPNDVMSGIAYKDDSIIISESNVAKVYGKEPGYLITLKGY